MVLLWMDEIHFAPRNETIGHHGLLVFFWGEGYHSVAERWCEMDFATIHSGWGGLSHHEPTSAWVERPS